jgi:hypothetical protein
MEALKLIIKFRFDEHSRTKSDSDEAFRLLTNASFPPKLLSLVFEAAVKAQVPRLLVNQSTTLATVAKAICSQWPKDLGSDVRGLLLQTTTRAILEHSLIKISATFNAQHELIVPPTLQGSEDLLRYLVLEVQSMPRENASIGRLNQGTESIGTLVCISPILRSALCCYISFMKDKRLSYTLLEWIPSRGLEATASSREPRVLTKSLRLKTALSSSLTLSSSEDPESANSFVSATSI